MSSCEDFHTALEQRLPLAKLDDQIAAHVRSCATCTEAMGVATALRDWAIEQPARSGLPSANHLWWRAQIIRDLIDNESKIESVTRSTRWLQIFYLGLLALPVTLGLTWLTANLAGDLQAQVATGSLPWRYLIALLVAGTALPLTVCAAWLAFWRES